MLFEVNIAQDKNAFSSGSLLCRGRYRLSEKYAIQQWADGAYETHWRAQDLQRGGASVTICAMEMPEMKVVATQAGLRTAMRALSSAGENPHIPVLLDVFRDNGRDCFVFALRSAGRSLFAHMQQTGKKLQEQEAIACCLQLTEVLVAISQQEPPMVHGFINPEHIMLAQNDQWVLTDFSIVLASGSNRYLTTNLDPSLLSPFVAPEFAQGVIDSRSDMYSLLMTVYYGMTGMFSTGHVLNVSLSPPFAAIFIKGLHPNASRRYQQLSDLRRDLQTVRPVVNTSAPVGDLTRKRNALVATNRQSQVDSTFASARREKKSGAVPPQEKRSLAPAMQQDSRTQTLSSLMFPRESEMLARELSPRSEVLVKVLPTRTEELANELPARTEELANEQPSRPEELAKELLPRPEELPPMQTGNNTLAATLWIVGIVACFLISVLLTVSY